MPRDFHRRVLSLVAISSMLLSAGCSKPTEPVATPTPAPAVAEPTQDIQPVIKGIDPLLHTLPNPDHILIMTQDLRAELLPGTTAYRKVLALCQKRIQRELGITDIEVPENDLQLEVLQGQVDTLIFEYTDNQIAKYCFDGFDMTVEFVRLMMPLGNTDNLPDAQEMIYFGSGEQYYSQPGRIDPPQEELLSLVATLGSAGGE